MAVNRQGIFCRTVDNEEEDREQMFLNVRDQKWQEWPNEAGFEGLDEHVGPIALDVQGNIPSWAAGSLFRTGPGQSSIENTSRGKHYVSHWFDGFAHTHRFDIRPLPSGSCAVSYSSRRQSEMFVEKIKEKGWRCSMSFAQRHDPCVGLFSKVMSAFQRTSNNNVVVELNVPIETAKVETKDTQVADYRIHVENAFVLTDSDTLLEIDPNTLEPLDYRAQSSFHQELKGNMGSAHSQRDPETGDLFNFNLAFGRYPTYRIFRINAATRTTDILASICFPDIKPAYIHSFFLTANYVVLCIPSTHFGWNGIKIPYTGNVVDAIEPFDESKVSHWVVVDRRSSKGVVARFKTPAGFFFHSVNAFEEVTKDDGEGAQTYLNLECVWYDTPDIIRSFYYDILLDRHGATREYWLDNEGCRKCQGRLTRYRFRMPSSTYNYGHDIPSAEEVFSVPNPHTGELPTINKAYTTRPHTYVYATATRSLSTMTDCIVKTDVRNGNALIWGAPNGHTPSEVIFIARPESRDEDDGVLLSVVLDGHQRRSYLLCLDARSLEEMGRAEVGFAVGIGFHGVHTSEVLQARTVTDEQVLETSSTA